ncbi:MAG: YgjV family protein [Caldimonas sp.]
MTSLLIHATGFAALALNVTGLIRTSDRSLRNSTGWASALWAVNNLLIGAHSAAALSVLSVGRQASASVVQGRHARTQLLTCCTFLCVTFLVGVLTWNGAATLLTTTGSLLATYAMFYMRGALLRIAMLAVAALWMYNAWAYDSWWQMFGNLVTGGAAGYGAWRAKSADSTNTSTPATGTIAAAGNA